MMFSDRAEAGRRLAERLLHSRDADPIVLALPRGGVPVAVPIAEVLGAPLDLLLVRKIGAPGHPELALGAVVEGEPPQTAVNEEIVEMLGVPADFVTEQAADRLKDIERRRRLWLHGRAVANPHGARSSSWTTALPRARRCAQRFWRWSARGPHGASLAAPVAPLEVAEKLRPLCDEAVFLAEPALFGSVSAFYDDFREIEDGEVTALLDGAAEWRRAG
jgi:putative phosphoribosyl transferase